MSDTGPPDRGALGAGSRTRSIWLSQLLLAAVVVVVALVVQALAPGQFMFWTFSAGVTAVVVVTAATLVVPWHRLPRNAALVPPVLDIVAIGLMEYGSGLYTSFLWVFPVIWIATHFTMVAMLSAGALICVMVVVHTAITGSDETTIARLLIVALSLTFLGMSTFLTARQTRAFKRLLQRQAGKLQETISRVRSQERRVRLMLNAIDTGIVRLSASGTILAVNDTYVSLYGLDRSDPARPGRSVEYSALRGDALGEHERPIARAARGEVLEEERVWLFDGQGDWHALSVSTRPLPASPDEAPSVLLVVHEITALIESRRAQERMAAVVSHELRNPLTAILGHAELLAEDETLTPRAREQVQVIEAASQRMRLLIDDILSRRPTETIAESTERTDVDLGRVVRASVESFRPAADAAGIALTLDLPDGLFVHGDAFRLRQVVDNLVSNAIKYTRESGHVTVRASEHGDTVRIRVSDDGVGIAPEDLPHVFEPYFRATSARESGVSGTGLGMGIARSIARAHGGDLTLESTMHEGTTAVVVLPRADRPAS